MMVAKYAKLLTALVLMLALLVCLPAAGMAETMEYALRSEFNLGENPEVKFHPYSFHVDNRDYVYEKFIRDWDEDGMIEADELNDRITIEWSGVEFVGEPDAQFGNHDIPEVLVATVASPTDDCEVKLVLTNTETGDTFVYTYELDCSYLYSKPMLVSVNGESIDTANSNSIEVPVGATVTLTSKDEYTGSKQHTYAYTWEVYENNVRTEPAVTGDTYTFTMGTGSYSVWCTTTLQFDEGAASGSSFHGVHFRSERADVVLNVQTSHPVVDGVISLNEGATLTIATNPTCEDSTIELAGYWERSYFDEEQRRYVYIELDETGTTLNLEVTADMNGNLIYGEVFGKDTYVDGAYIEYTLNVMPKSDETIALNVQSTHPVANNVLTVTEGETVTITPNPSCSEPDATFVHFWLLGTRNDEGKFVEEAMLGRESTYSFVASSDMNGKYINYSAGRTGYKPGSFEYQLNVTPKQTPSVTLNVQVNHPVVDDVITVTEGDTVTIATNPTCTDSSVELVNRWFMHTYDNSGECVGEEQLSSTASTLTFTATADMNGKHVYCEVNGKNFQTYTAIMDYKLKVMTKVPELDEAYVLDVDEGITTDTLSEELKAIPELNTPQKVETDITIKVLAEAKSAGLEVETVQEQTAVYDVTLMYSEDGGETFVEATKENWPESGKITVTLPYPEGTGQFTHTFVVAHMFTQTTDDHRAGDVEYPVVTNTPRGIQFQVSGLSPIAIAWEEKPEAPAVPKTGDSATPYLWLLGMMTAGIGCAVLVNKRRQNI